MDKLPTNMDSIRRVAVTGGSGQIGTRVVRRLVETGYDVLSIDRRDPNEPLCEFVTIDLRDRDAVLKALRTVEAVCHLGEKPAIRRDDNPDQIAAANFTIAATVLQSAADLGHRRIIYTSSCQVYGTWGQGQSRINPMPPASLPVTEAHPLRPLNAYALAKCAAEQYAQMLWQQNRSLSIAIFRFPATVDPLTRPGSWGRTRPGEKAGVGLEMGTWLHVEDAAEAYRLGLGVTESGCEAYHFTAEDFIGNGPIQKALMERYPTAPLLPPDWPADRSPVDCSKAMVHFGWRPTWRLRDACPEPARD